MNAHRASFLCIIAPALAVASVASGAIHTDTLWTASGVRVCTTPSRQVNPLLARDGQGGVLISWCDARAGSGVTNIYATRLDALGARTPGWPDTGVKISQGYAFDEAMAGDGTGGAFFTWPVGLTVTMQHALGNGTLATTSPPSIATRSRPASGSVAAPDGLEKYEPTPFAPLLVPDGTGGTFVCWMTWTISHDETYVQDVTGTGFAAPNWPAPLELASSSDTFRGPTVCNDGANGVYMAWSMYAWGDTTQRVFIDHAVSSGSIAPGWMFGGLPVCRAGGPQESPAVVADGAGGAFVFWNDSRNLGNSKLYAIRIMADTTCAPGWPADGLVISSHVCQPNTSSQDTRAETQSVAGDGHGGAFITWSDSRSDSGDVFLQHVLPDGTHPGWPAEGVPVCTAAGIQSSPQVASDGQGGAFVAWQDLRAGAISQIYVQHVIAEGIADPTWPALGLAVCSTGTNQEHPVIEGDGARGAFIAWQDARSGTSTIYAARVTSDAIVPAEMSLVSSDVTDGVVHLTWDASLHRDETFSVERRTETSGWGSVATETPDASGLIQYADHDVASGARYGYRLWNGAQGVAETWISIPASSGPDLALVAASPARRVLSIRFSLPDAGAATLSLIDLAGRVLAQRALEGFGAGDHGLEWNAGPIEPGIYFVRLAHGARSITRRVALIR